MTVHDVLVVGGGIAGLRAAIEARRSGLDVGLVSKSHPLRSHSCTSQVGINGVLKSDDSWEDFAEDVIRASDYLADQDAVEALCREAGPLVLELDSMGVPFNRDASGRLDRRHLPGARQALAAYAGDITGQTILHTLYEQALRAGVVGYDETHVVGLAVSESQCHGVVARELRTGRVLSIDAGAVLLASGSAGQMYRRTTASLSCTGDGVALAYEAGAELMDMEMVQFHPTALAGRGVLVSEAVLAEGGVLVHGDGQVTGRMVPRDIASRAVEDAMAARSDGAVSLDGSSIDTAQASKTLKHTRHLVKSLTAQDLFTDKVPVRPAAHRHMGGVRIDLDGATNISGLFAAGETACSGVHGASALGGNTLAEAVVFGRRAGASAGRYAKQTQRRQVPATLVAQTEERLRAPLSRGATADNSVRIRGELQALMDRAAGIYRDGASLAKAQEETRELKVRLSRAGVADHGAVFDSGVLGYTEVENLLGCAEAVIAAASVRAESRGAHSRKDYPSRDDQNWLKHTIVTKAPDGPKMDTAPVNVIRWQPAERTY